MSSKTAVFRQIMVTFIATMSILISGMWLGWPSSVVTKFINHETDFDVNMEQLSWIVSLMDLGNVVSPLFAGYMMDRMGRKWSTATLGPLFLASWLLALYVPTPWALYTARTMAGLGKGVSYTVVPVYLGEIAGVNIRGALSSVFCIQLHLGLLVEAVLGPLMSYHALNAVSAAVPAVFLVAVLWIHESPHYLLRRERPAAAAESLRWYRGGGDVAAELRSTGDTVRREMENRSTFRELFASRKDRRALGVVVVACVSQRAGGISCVIAYSALILPEPAPVMPRSGYIMLFTVVMVVVNLAAAALIDRAGRRPLLLVSQAAMAACTALFAVHFCWLAPGGRVPWLPYACHVAFGVAFASGAGFVPVVLLGEMFPVNVRSHCSAISSVTLAVCSFATNRVFLPVTSLYGHHAMFAAFAAVNVFGFVYTYAYLVETKGKTFEQIQQLLADQVRDRTDGTSDATATRPPNP